MAGGLGCVSYCRTKNALHHPHGWMMAYSTNIHIRGHALEKALLPLRVHVFRWIHEKATNPSVPRAAYEEAVNGNPRKPVVCA